MNLRDLEYLVALAEHRHFGRAADAVFVSQPTLSGQIRKLEAELGVELFERSSRETILTEVGEHVVERARRALQEVEAMRDVARLSQDPESGTMRLGIFPTLAPYLLPHVIHGVHERFPQLELLLVEEKTDELVARLRDGRLDAAIIATPIAADGLHEHHLFDEDFVLAVPADHPLAHTGTATISTSSLSSERVLLLEEGHCLRDQALSVCQSIGAVERAGFRATSLETLRQMVATDVGVTLLPRLAVSAPVPASAGVALVEFDSPPRRHLAMFWRETNPYREFLPRLAEAFADLPASLVH